MVLLTSGWTVPLAFNSVGRLRLSTLTVWNSSGWSTVRRFGSTVISCFVGAALVSFEHATKKPIGARHRRKAANRRIRAAKIFGAATGGRDAATAPQESADCTALAALELRENLDCDVMGLPRGPRPDLIGLLRSGKNQPSSHSSLHHCGIPSGRSRNRQVMSHH